ncbi:MAG: hypothetical protein ACHREM_16390 [Polyangiales bacterium]
MRPDEARDPNVDEDVPASGARRIPRLPPPRRPAIPWHVVIGIAGALSCLALIYYFFYARAFARQKQALLDERRELDRAIAADWATVRNRVEEYVVLSANAPYSGDRIDDEAKQGVWRTKPSLYVRVRVADAMTKESLHAAAKLTADDALESCLLRVVGDHGPWTFGETAARAEMLGSAWITDVRDTSNDLRVRNLAYGLDQYKLKDYPPLREAVHFAEFAIVALDEDPKAIPAKSAAYENATIAQKITAVPHPIRVQVLRLNDGKELLRVRRTSDAELMQVQGEAFAAAGALEIRRGQALGCATANEVLAALGLGVIESLHAGAPPVPVTPSPVASVSASVSGSASAATSAPR